MTAQKIVPNLWFEGNAKEAVDYYVSVFKDGQILETSHYPTEGLADFQQPLAGKVLTVSFEMGGLQYMAINAGPEFKFTEAVSFMVSCESQDEIDYFWEKLSAMPEAEQCGWCKDKYGLSWQIIPANMKELLGKPGGFETLMKQHKIIISEY